MATIFTVTLLISTVVVSHSRTHGLLLTAPPIRSTAAATRKIFSALQLFTIIRFTQSTTSLTMAVYTVLQSVRVISNAASVSS